jgi:hypothetical protein
MEGRCSRRPSIQRGIEVSGRCRVKPGMSPLRNIRYSASAGFGSLSSCVIGQSSGTTRAFGRGRCMPNPVAKDTSPKLLVRTYADSIRTHGDCQQRHRAKCDEHHDRSRCMRVLLRPVQTAPITWHGCPVGGCPVGWECPREEDREENGNVQRRGYGEVECRALPTQSDGQDDIEDECRQVDDPEPRPAGSDALNGQVGISRKIDLVRQCEQMCPDGIRARAVNTTARNWTTRKLMPCLRLP